MTHKAIVLAAGQGTRMRRAVPGLKLTDSQEAAANQGHKGLLPIERPFLDYLLSNLVAAGCQQVCLVIGPQHESVRTYYQNLAYEHLQLEFAIQMEPLGTAHALLAAESFAGEDPVLILNGDNLYPAATLEQLRNEPGFALTGFDRNGLIANANLTAERIVAFALLQVDEGGALQEIIEKPNLDTYQQMSEQLLVSMNCWRMLPEIFPACRRISLSPRNEYELPAAVMWLIRHQGTRFQVVPSSAGVLDLSCREDILNVTQRLRGVKVII